MQSVTMSSSDQSQQNLPTLLERPAAHKTPQKNTTLLASKSSAVPRRLTSSVSPGEIPVFTACFSVV